ncbi:MAG: hypothetical protein Q4E26_10315 [Prevotellaceae bacterium]|nr:hypothetical protein [Prevotellaceae bacterium]
MKKFTLAIVAFAAMLFASCGGSKTQQEATDQDTTPKTFEQAQLEAAVKMHLDSLSTQINEKQFAAIEENIKAGKIKLSNIEKKVKPMYLLSPSIVQDITSIGQKYAAMAMLKADKEVAALYEMDVKGYEEAAAKLAADINDPALKKAEGATSAVEQNKVLYKEMSDEGRINFYWILTSAATVESLYVMSQNVEKYCAGYTDEQIANITFRLVCIINALNDLSVYDAQIQGIAEALNPLDNINATTLADFKKELQESKEKIEASRAAFLK